MIGAVSPGRDSHERLARRAGADGPNGGVADSLDEAKAAFRAEWDRLLSSEKADEICST